MSASPITYRLANESDVKDLVRLRFAYLHADFGELDPDDVEKIKQQLPTYLKTHLSDDLHAQAAFC